MSKSTSTSERSIEPLHVAQDWNLDAPGYKLLRCLTRYKEDPVKSLEEIKSFAEMEISEWERELTRKR